MLGACGVAELPKLKPPPGCAIIGVDPAPACRLVCCCCCCACCCCCCGCAMSLGGALCMLPKLNPPEPEAAGISSGEDWAAAASSSEPFAPPPDAPGVRDDEEEIDARAPALGLGLPPRALAALPLPRKLNLPDMLVGRACTG